MPKKGRQIKAEERRRSVAEALKAGYTYRAIAEALDASVGTVANDVKTLIDRWQKEQVNSAGEWIALQIVRLETALNAIWQDVLNGDLAAIGRMQALIDQEARLKGYDKPLKVEWQSEVLALVLAGKVTLDEVRAELGSDLATELFASTGLNVKVLGTQPGEEA